MRTTLEEVNKRFPNHPVPASPEYAGQWVAWSDDRRQVIAHGNSFKQVRDQAMAAGCLSPLMQKVLSTPFVGGA